MDTESASPKTHVYSVIRQTWLSRRLNTNAVLTAWLATLGVAWAAFMNWTDSWHAATWMPATGHQVFKMHQYWRAWTTLLVHADLHHLLANLLLFFIMGAFLAGYFGVLIFPLLAFACGGLFNLLVLYLMPDDVALVGVSGVVYWMGGFWLVLYFCLDTRKTLTQRGLRAAGVGLVLFAPAQAFERDVSYLSHLVGFIWGLTCGSVFFISRKEIFRAAEVREIVVEEE